MRRWSTVLILLGLLAVTSPAQAALVYNMDTAFYGVTTPPQGPTPWVTATFEQVATNVVRLTVTAPHLLTGEKIGGLYFNYDPTKTLSASNFARQSSSTAPSATLSVGRNAYKADGDGYFDVFLSLPTTSKSNFGVGETLVYLITAAGITPDWFSFVSVNGPVLNTAYPVAAHILGIGPNGSNSAWVSTAPVVTPVVPEPASLAVWSLLGGLAMLVARRR